MPNIYHPRQATLIQDHIPQEPPDRYLSLYSYSLQTSNVQTLTIVHDIYYLISRKIVFNVIWYSDQQCLVK